MSEPFEKAHELAKRPMTAEETRSILELLVQGTLSEARGAELIQTWAARGETGTELCATVRFLKERAISVPVDQPCFDLCGTGGSGLSRFNVSTTVAFIAAAAGVPVAKHGNRGSRLKNGSFDLLEALEVPFDLTPEQEAEVQRETGLCFLFARTHHPAVGRVAPYRKAAGCRSIFNLAGPLANPAAIRHQMIGTTNEKTAQVVATALRELKSEGAWVLWGEPGIDEISVTGKTGILQVSAAGIKRSELSAIEHLGLDYASLPNGDAAQNRATFLSLLGGELGGPLLSMVCENAGAAIDLWNGRDPSLGGAGAVEARRLVAEGQALKTFERHRAVAQRLAASS